MNLYILLLFYNVNNDELDIKNNRRKLQFNLKK